MMTAGEATSSPYKNMFSSYCLKKQMIVLQTQKMLCPFKRHQRSEERNTFQRTVFFCAGNLGRAQILRPGIWNHRNYHHRNNCFKLGSLALICPPARSVRVHIFSELIYCMGLEEGKMWKKP